MAEAIPVLADKKRKTISLTHKQIGIGGGVIASLALVSQLKGMFVPVEKSVAQDQQIDQIVVAIQDLKEEVVHLVERNTDKITERLKETDERMVRIEDKLERRIEALENKKH